MSEAVKKEDEETVYQIAEWILHQTKIVDPNEMSQSKTIGSPAWLRILATRLFAACSRQFEFERQLYDKMNARFERFESDCFSFNAWCMNTDCEKCPLAHVCNSEASYSALVKAWMKMRKSVTVLRHGRSCYEVEGGEE